MNRHELAHLLGEKTALEQMIAETPPEEAIDRASLLGRLDVIESRIAAASVNAREPARARLTFRGRPVVDTHGIFAEFGARAVSSFTESVAAMAASFTAPLAAMGPIPNRDQHQMLITSTALGSFGFELEEHRTGQTTLDEQSPVAQALERTRTLLEGTLGTDEQLADSAAEADARALDKVRAFLQVLLDGEATCAVQVGDARVSFSDVGQVRVSLARLSRENLREERETLVGALRGVLPEGRMFELKIAEDGQVIRGKIGPAIQDPDALLELIHKAIRVDVMTTRVGKGRPRYVLMKVLEEGVRTWALGDDDRCARSPHPPTPSPRRGGPALPIAPL